MQIPRSTQLSGFTATFNKHCLLPSLFNLLILLTSYCPSANSQAADLTLSNPGFEEWNKDQNLPAGWIGKLASHSASQDCDTVKEGKCSLRLESQAQTLPGVMSFIGQTLPASRVGGHPLKLSGWIKTRDLKNGSAMLLLQVDGKAKSAVAEASTGKDSPTGSQDWRRFEIQVPVAANEKFVHAIIGISGNGAAWFDDLKIEVLEEIKVADLAEVVRPPRPQKSEQLEDENSQRLTFSQMPEIKAEWQAGAREESHSLRSLFSDDFSDLQFLKPLLKDKRVVQLGESAHGIAEYNWMKLRLLKFLHKEMGFDVIAMESAMTGCDAVNQDIGKLPALDSLRNCVFGTLATEEVLDLFSYLQENSQGGHALSLAGFDIQNSGWISASVVANRFKSLLTVTDKVLAGQVDDMESQLNRLLNKDKSVAAEDLASRYAALAEHLLKNREQLLQQFPQKKYEIEMAIQEARSRVAYCQMLPYPYPQKQGTEIRDKAMADNLDFLLTTIYPQKKVVVWAHNSHIIHDWADKKKAKSMGAWLLEKHRAELYTIGFYMGHGVMYNYFSDGYSAFEAPPKSGLEAILANAGHKLSFIDFSQAKPGNGNSWMYSAINARYWGSTPEKIIPASAYDAVIYFDTVTPSIYVK